MAEPHRIGFVATRLAGTDGVSLEVVKWVNALQELNCECFFFAGECDWPAARTYQVPEAHFAHPDILTLNATLFWNYTRTPETSQAVRRLTEHLKSHLYQFVRRFNIQTLIAENALSLPMNIPLGLALTEFIAETSIATVGHHHDFYWERERYAVSAAEDYLRTAFPPTLRSIQHVVINSFASRQLALRTASNSVLIPNVMDFAHPPPAPDAHAAGLRAELGLQPGEYLLLQPTRIVPRKRIELAITLARELELPCALVISHASGDEGEAYQAFLERYAQALGARVLFAADRFNHARQTGDDGIVYSLADAYQQADLVTYPSRVEGFGNAFLETIYYRRPIVMSTYEIFKTDIEPKGFWVVGFEDFVTDETIRQTREILENPGRTAEIVEHNYELGRHYYSFRALEEKLVSLITPHTA